MKSQDILLLLKIVSLAKNDRTGGDYLHGKWQDWESEATYQLADDGYWEPEVIYQLPDDVDWESEVTYHLEDDGDWESVHLSPVATHEHSSVAQYSVRALAEMTGISKSQVSLSLARCYESGIARPDRLTDVPRVNTTALGEFLVYGLKYVFPARRGSMTRGIATAWAAPVLGGRLLSGGDTAPVWPDASGNTKGLLLEPIYKTVPEAVKKDPTLYGLLALVDAIRIGLARERAIAIDLLIKMLELENV